jgi:hypothetical protein
MPGHWTIQRSRAPLAWWVKSAQQQDL